MQRANGWCKLVLNLICIAHPGVAGLMAVAIGTDVRLRYKLNLARDDEGLCVNINQSRVVPRICMIRPEQLTYLLLFGAFLLLTKQKLK